MIDAAQLQPTKRSLEERLFPGRKYETVLPFPIETVRRRLQAAFVSPITKKPGFPMARSTYEGKIDGDNVEVRYTCYGKGTLRYNASGRLFAGPDGTHFEMILRPRQTMWQLIVQMVVGYIAIGVAAWYFGAGPLMVLPLALVFGTCWAAAMLSLAIAGVAMTTNTAATSINQMLAEEISGMQ
ncbi:MAG TPA: hypothetical protein VHL50_09395 [Pyrinomonadaceae bacterium]|nr:hypothetical protein [Pyrinomonadaceae bacterium]